MFKAPDVGSVVHVTTWFRNHYFLTADKQPFQDNTYEGTVLPAEKWDEPYTFNMTGIRGFPTRNISLQHVIKMDILGGKAKRAVKSDIRVFKVESKSNVYTVTKDGAKYSCTCVGFQYHRTCKHSKAVHAKVG